MTQSGECSFWVLAREAETLDEGVPHARGGGDVGVHESMCLFESVRSEKCPCENGMGFVIGGEFVGV